MNTCTTGMWSALEIRELPNSRRTRFHSTSEKDRLHPIPTLLYHILDPELREGVSLSPSLFNAHLDAIVETGYVTASLSALFRGAKASSEFAREIIITFDDAYVDCLEVAAPEMGRRGLQGIVFVVTDATGKSNDWNPKARYHRRHLGWSGLRELIDVGFEIGSHSCSHRSMPKLPRGDLEHEIIDSKHVLEDILQVPIRSFAYPYGDVDTRTAQITASLYEVAFAVRPVANCAAAVRHRLPRVPMRPHHDPAFVRSALEVSPWMLAA